MGFKGHGMTDEQVTDAVSRLNEAIEKSTKKENTNQQQTNAKISLTDNAINKIKELIQKENKQALRISIMPGGCSGFMYDFRLDDKSTDNDIIIEEKGIKVFIDKSSIEQIDGASIDYLDSLQGAGFKVDNPQATQSCGCGSSFS